MPVTLTYPGVYIEELPSGVRTITGVATSITAFVGYTAEGQVDKAVRIFNFGDYERAFGGLNRDSEIGYAVQQFFVNGGSDAYVVRVAQGAVAAQITLGSDTTVTPTPVLHVSALTPGLWGNNLRLDVDYATTNPDSTFNLTVTRYELQGTTLVPIAAEQHRNLGMNSNASNFAPRVVTAASQLIKVERPIGLTYPDKGYSLSGKLNPFPTLTTSNVALNLIVDGTDPITLVLTSQPNTPAALVTALTAAITAAGATSRLVAKRANALGDDATGDFVRLESKDATERSSVEVIPAPVNDASAKLLLGLGKGGREKAGAGSRRPVPTGTTSADLADVVNTNVSGDINVVVNDNSTGPPVAIFTAPTPITLTNVPVGKTLADVIQTWLRALGNAATNNATVTFIGTTLQVTPSAATPNASIIFSAAGATNTRLTADAGAFNNVQQYALGVGATFKAQIGAVGGANGSPPNATTLIGSFNAKTGLFALRDVDLFNLLVIPSTSTMDDTQAKSVMAAAVAFCIQERAFYIVDPNPTKTWDTVGAWVDSLGIKERNAATFFPQVQVADPLDDYRLANRPPSGTVAGVFARTDSTRGVWKAPAGIDATLAGVQGLAQTLTDQENGALNPLGINCLRSFPVYGRVVWGARTMRGADQIADEYKYIPVRRLALFIEESLYRGTQWVVFEPNDEPLWAQIRLNLGAFMHDLFVQGAFQGKAPRDAYFVKCDRETTTQNDINKGIVNIVVGFAPLKPAEFVIIKLQQMAGQIQV
jgi:uncharacterized protein